MPRVAAVAAQEERSLGGKVEPFRRAVAVHDLRHAGRPGKRDRGTRDRDLPGRIEVVDRICDGVVGEVERRRRGVVDRELLVHTSQQVQWTEPVVLGRGVRNEHELPLSARTCARRRSLLSIFVATPTVD